MKSILTQNDTALMERLFSLPVPVSYEYDGIRYTGIPAELSPKTVRTAADDGTVLHTVTARLDDRLEVRAEITEYRDFAAADAVVFFTNTGGADTKPLRSPRIEKTLPFTGGVLYHGNGDTCDKNGYSWSRTPVCGGAALQTADGTSCNGAFPYMRLLFGGFGINIGIGWPAGWSASFSETADGTLVSIGQQRFDSVLRPGETMRTPRVSLVAYAGDEARGRNMWRRWYFAHILPRTNGHPVAPMCCMHTPGIGGHPEFTGITEENQLSGIDDYLNAGLRPDVWWIDAGWYPCDYDWPTVGTWKCDPVRLPNGLEPIGRKCAENGWKLLVWFEPERARPGTELPAAHPEWMLYAKDENGVPMENILVDLGSPDCRAWITDRVDRIIKESGIGIYRQDFNFSPKEYWRQNEPDGRIGALENLHAQGYLAYWDELLARNPGLIIDSCAGGGRRNDPETMRRAVPLHYTDIGYGNHPVKQKQHRQMFEWIPYFRAHNMSWDRPDGSYGFDRVPVDEFAYQAALAPALTDMTPHDAPPEAMALAKRMQALWRRAAGIMLDADYYPLTECRGLPEDWYAMQFHDPDTGKGFFQVLRNTRAEEDRFTVHLEALEDGLYAVTDSRTGQRFTCGADALRSYTAALEKRSAAVFFYEKIGG